jgi:hypothetical protein
MTISWFIDPEALLDVRCFLLPAGQQQGDIR